MNEYSKQKREIKWEIGGFLNKETESSRIWLDNIENVAWRALDNGLNFSCGINKTYSRGIEEGNLHKIMKLKGRRIWRGN